MKTQPKNQTFGWIPAFPSSVQRAQGVVRILSAIVVFTVAPFTALNATTPATVGTSFPLYVSGMMATDTGALVASVIKLDSSGAPTSFASGGTLDNPCGGAFDGSGNLFIVNACLSFTNPATIVKLDAAGTPTVFASGGNLVRP